MKDLQACIDVVLQLQAIHDEKEFTLTGSCAKELDSYADQLIPEEDTKKDFCTDQHTLAEPLKRKER